MAAPQGKEEAAESLEWDMAAEEELLAIEAAFATKRNSSHLDQRSRCHPRRRLPDWANNAAPWRRSADGPSPLLPCQVNIKMRHPSMTFGGRIVYCRTIPEVEQAASDLVDKIRDLKQNADRISLGFDIEWRPVFRRGQEPTKAAVMQICMDTSHCYVMHIIHSGIPPSLKSLLEDCSSVKVGVAIANDATKILRDYNVCVEPLEDLSVVANLKLGGTYKRWSLASLTEMLTCKELAKPNKIRMGNWEARTLSREQLQYAATDAFVSWYLYEVLKSFPDSKSDNGSEEKANDVQS